MDRLVSGMLIVACAVGILAAGTYLAKSYRVDCLDWFMGRTCAVTQR